MTPCLPVMRTQQSGSRQTCSLSGVFRSQPYVPSAGTATAWSNPFLLPRCSSLHTYNDTIYHHHHHGRFTKHYHTLLWYPNFHPQDTASVLSPRANAQLTPHSPARTSQLRAISRSSPDSVSRSAFTRAHSCCRAGVLAPLQTLILTVIVRSLSVALSLTHAPHQAKCRA
jgi:hypothetical protein